MSGRHGGRGKDIGKKIKEHREWNKTEHWKYPETVGNDTRVDNINFNSHDSSEYAIERMDAVSTMTQEPFIMFEFMKINEEKAVAKIKSQTEAVHNSYLSINPTEISAQDIINAEEEGVRMAQQGNIDNRDDSEIMDANSIANSWVDKTIRAVASWFKDLVHTAERDYIGSIALYMPTDIQINDQMVYNEDTRKIGALMESISDGKSKLSDIMNATVLTTPEILGIITAGIGKVADKWTKFGGGTSTALGGIIGYGIGDILQTELQRSTGKIMNPNELLRYQQTGLRSFTFNWTFLPDNQNESHQTQGLIRMFRKAAHATKTSSTMITVPDHVITSFHGARSMIQIPPCYIESVNVTYNPNTSSFFKRNNAPVEVGLSLSLKEIVPIYSDDVEERGY